MKESSFAHNFLTFMSCAFPVSPQLALYRSDSATRMADSVPMSSLVWVRGAAMTAAEGGGQPMNSAEAVMALASALSRRS